MINTPTANGLTPLTAALLAGLSAGKSKHKNRFTKKYQAGFKARPNKPREKVWGEKRASQIKSKKPKPKCECGAERRKYVYLCRGCLPKPELIGTLEDVMRAAGGYRSGSRAIQPETTRRIVLKISLVK